MKKTLQPFVYITNSAAHQLGEPLLRFLRMECRRLKVNVAREQKDAQLIAVPSYSQALVFASSEDLADHRWIQDWQNVEIALLESETDVVVAEQLVHSINHAPVRYLVNCYSIAATRFWIRFVLQKKFAAKQLSLEQFLTREVGYTHKQLRATSMDFRETVEQFVESFFKEKIAQRKGRLAGIRSFPKLFADCMDELMMNAFWDANKLSPDKHRLEQVEPIQIRVSSTREFMTVSVTDKFGTFPFQALLKHFAFALGDRNEMKVNEGPGGAGLGIFMVLQKAGALVVEVHPGKKTSVHALLRYDASLKETQRQPRTLLYFSET